MNTKTLFAAIMAALPLASCIQGEPENSECDITGVTLHLNAPESFFYTISDTAQTIGSADSVITFAMRRGANLTSITPLLRLTDGAKVTPASGQPQDFSQGSVYYTVTSQDGLWHRVYEMRCVIDTSLVTYYSFDHYEKEPSGKYYVWYECNSNGTRNNCWDSGNPGYKIARSSAKPEEYPAVPVETGGVDGGSYLKLETVGTGGFGAMVNMRLAAGNLFIGTFDAQYALKDQMQATCFGIPFTRKPKSLTGWYQYTPGASIMNREGKPYEAGSKSFEGVTLGTTDMPDIYACFYEGTLDGANFVLHGDDAMHHPNLVALARIPHENNMTTDGWTYFDIPFDYETFGKVIDPEKLANRQYKMCVVFSSSIGGAEFVGAIGSTLLIDNVELICEEEE